MFPIKYILKAMWVYLMTKEKNHATEIAQKHIIHVSTFNSSPA